MKNADAWREYYSQCHTLEPSDFGIWVNSQLAEERHIVDLGCGNGRDSYMFARNWHSVLGIDASCCPPNEERVKFQTWKFQDFFLYPAPHQINVVYSRFVLHSIDAETEDELLSWSAKNLVNDGLIALEARSAKGVAPPDNKWRRLIDLQVLVGKLLALRFEILSTVEADDLAVFGNENPIVVRVLARKR